MIKLIKILIMEQPNSTQTETKGFLKFLRSYLAYWEWDYISASDKAAVLILTLLFLILVPLLLLLLGLTCYKAFGS